MVVATGAAIAGAEEDGAATPPPTHPDAPAQSIGNETPAAADPDSVEDAAEPPVDSASDPAADELEEEELEDELPPRSRRMFALTGSMGWNALAGFALGGTFNIGPHVSTDIAFGVAAIGIKAGTRVRYNLFESDWTPSFGVGFQYGPGSGGESVIVNGQDGDAEVIIERSAFVQGLAAMSYQGQGGFTALFGAGYSLLLDDDNVQFVSGDEDTADITRFVSGSGIVLEVALGYAF